MTTIYTASALTENFPSVEEHIHRAAVKADCEHVVIPSKNLWVRDWLPVPCLDKLCLFRYCKDFHKYPQLKLERNVWPTNDYTGHTARFSNIVADNGGALAVHGDKCIVTDTIYQRNPCVPPRELIKTLEKFTGCRVIVIPTEPGDTLGHADGMVHWINEDHCFVNCYEPHLFALIRVELSEAGVDAVPFPWIDPLDSDFEPETEAFFRERYPITDDWLPAFGYYINFLVLGSVVVVPSFHIWEDDQVVKEVERAFHGCEVVQVDCRELCMLGGLVNCVTWEY